MNSNCVFSDSNNVSLLILSEVPADDFSNGFIVYQLCSCIHLMIHMSSTLHDSSWHDFFRYQDFSMEELPCESKLLILDWRHIVSAHYYWLSTVSFLLNLRWKSYRFYLWILLIKYVFFSLFLQAFLQICRGINCAVTYQSAVQFTGLIFFQLTLHNYEVFWFIYIHSALHIRWCWCWEILASFLLWLLDLGNFIGIANCSYECYSYVTYSLFLFIYCPEMQF
jgi:hypothetical protein